MRKYFASFLITLYLFILQNAFAQSSDSIILTDIAWDKSAPAGMNELLIPSGNSLLAGFIYKANGAEKHTTLLLLHGFPGNERNLDLAQVVRAHGWNVVYFDYRGSWGSQGQFSFANCVEDVKNAVAYCKKNADSLRIDTTNIVLFGHSMGGWICLKSLSQIQGIKKGFALSTWDIAGTMKNVKTEEQMMKFAKENGEYFVLNTSLKNLYQPVIMNRSYYDLTKDADALANKQIICSMNILGTKKLQVRFKTPTNLILNTECGKLIIRLPTNE